MDNKYTSLVIGLIVVAVFLPVEWVIVVYLAFAIVLIYGIALSLREYFDRDSK